MSEARPPIEPSPAPTSGVNSEQQNYGKRAARGFLFILLNTGATKLLQIAAIAVIGDQLNSREMGLISIALAVGAFITTFRDGGVRDFLVARHKDYASLSGPGFWMSGTINLTLGFVLGLVGEVYAARMAAEGRIENARELANLIWVMAAALPLATPASTMPAKLKIDLRFKALSWQMTIAAGVRYITQITLALMGWGAMSYVIPLIVIALCEGLFLYLCTREKPWTQSPNFSLWPEIWRHSQWMVYASVMAGIAAQGFSSIAGWFLPAQTALEICGLLFFGLQFLYAIEGLVGVNLLQVMLPVLARLNDEPERQARAALRVLELVMLISAPMLMAASIGFACVSPMAWGDKWLGAIAPLFILTIGFIPRNAQICVAMPLTQARGQYKSYFAICAVSAGSTILGAAIGGAIVTTPEALAVFIAAAVAASHVGSTIWVMRSAGIRRRVVIDAMLRSTLITCSAAGFALMLRQEVLQDLSQRVLPTVLTIKRREIPLAPMLEACLSVGVFVGVFTVLARILASNQLRDAADALPARLGGPIRKALRL